MRGKDAAGAFRAAAPGITPAYAGKRFSCLDRPQLLRDHPRLCGEKCSVICMVRLFLGSPPPMRGKGFKYIHAKL